MINFNSKSTITFDKERAYQSYSKIQLAIADNIRVLQSEEATDNIDNIQSSINTISRWIEWVDALPSHNPNVIGLTDEEIKGLREGLAGLEEEFDNFKNTLNPAPGRS